MKFLNLKLKFTKKLTLFFFLFAMVATIAASQTFDRNLDVLAKLHFGNKHAELLSRIAGLKASPELADLRLFLEAEALKNLNRKAEAFSLYSQIIQKYPETEMAFQSRMPHFMMQLETVDDAGVVRLEALAKKLSTPWQRGTALQKLQDLPSLKAGRKSRIALQALREYASETPFYNTAPASSDLLKKILFNSTQYEFIDDEWLEILLQANSENVLKEFFKNGNSLKPLPGKLGQSVTELFKAENLRQQKKLPQAMAIYNAVINASKASPKIFALACQLRGDANHFADQHAAAFSDYRVALKNHGFPVNTTAAEYRMMRSAFRLGKDAECLELLARLVKNPKLGSLFPVHIYEMGLECFDQEQKARSVPYFMLLARNFPGHHRADDALGYAAMSVGSKTSEGQAILKLLKKKYSNSFYISWVAPEARKTVLLLDNAPIKKLSPETQERVAAMKKLWKTEFAVSARAEAIKLTDKYPANLPLYKSIIDIARENNDYNQLVAYGERLARQILDTDKSLSDMPEWGWKALYPVVLESQVRANANEFGIDPFWILSIMREESHFKADTLSRSNAMSLMQILPSTGAWIAGKLGEKGFHKEKLWKTDLNIRYGAWYLRYLADLFNGDLYLASASYNGGQGNIQRKVEAGPYARLPVLDRLDRVPLPETRDYYKKVMGSYWNYTRLYSRN